MATYLHASHSPVSVRIPLANIYSMSLTKDIAFLRNTAVGMTNASWYVRGWGKVVLVTCIEH
jgi:hypothetical protein